MRVTYPLVVNRRDARVPLLRICHERLTTFAQVTGRGEDWADMALRVMLEYERSG